MLRQFVRSSNGNLNVIFAIAAVPLFAALAGAIDFTTMNRKAGALHNALDAAALEVAIHHHPEMSEAEMRAIGWRAFKANIAGLQRNAGGPSELDDEIENSFFVTADSKDGAEYITASSTVAHQAMLGWSNNWRTQRSSTARLQHGMPACMLALDREASPGITLQGSTNVELEGCILASNSVASNSISRGGSARIAAKCAIASGGTTGIKNSGNARFECATPLERQFPALDPLSHFAPPPYTDCRGVPGGKTNTLSPGTYCNQTLSGEITLEPGTYILRGGRVNLGGNGRLTGDGVTIFLMEDARFSITANQIVQLSPPREGPFAGITIYQVRTNGNQITINGGADSFVDGFVYAPGAHIFHAGNSDTVGGGKCLRLVGASIELTGNSDLQSDCQAELGDRELHAGRRIAIHR